MSHLTGQERGQYVQAMFGRIAKRYDLLNRLMTLGQDKYWRKDAIQKLALKANSVVIDLGSGTGDIALEIANTYPDSFVIASDFTAEMLRVGKERANAHKVAWLIADAQHLPFAKECFNGVISGFLLRNVPYLEKTLQEQFRVLKPGNHAVSLDTSPPRKNILRPFLLFHLNVIIPLLGKLVAGDSEAYTYLPSSTEKFLGAEDLAKAFETADFKQVGFLRRMFGTIAIHWGLK